MAYLFYLSFRTWVRVLAVLLEFLPPLGGRSGQGLLHMVGGLDSNPQPSPLTFKYRLQIREDDLDGQRLLEHGV